MTNQHVRQPPSPDSADNRLDFSRFSQRMLRSAANAAPLYDFFAEITRRLLDCFACDSVELWVKRDGMCLRCEAKNGADCTFEMETKPSAAMPSAPDGINIRGDSAVLPVVAAGENVGLLLLKSRWKKAFSPKAAESYRVLSQSLGLALVSKLAHAALHERVKELTCLYGLAQLAEHPEVRLEEFLRGVVKRLPPAWQYPEITVARITLDGREYATDDFCEGAHRQSAEIVIGSRRRGAIDVVYVEPRPELDEGPFLKEERNLIDAVARQIALVVERRQASDEKLRLQGQLRHADRLATIGQLAAGVAHELNEPLGNILAFAQLAEKQPKIPRQTAADLEKIVTASLHAREIIKKLMLFARQMPPQKTPVDLSAVVAESLFFLESRAAKCGVTVRRRLARRLPRDYGRSLAVEPGVGEPPGQRLSSHARRRHAENRHSGDSQPCHYRGRGRRDRHERRSARKNLHSLFHDQGRQRRHGPRPARGAWHRHGARRHDRRAEPFGPRDAIRDSPPFVSSGRRKRPRQRILPRTPANDLT